MKIYVKKIWSWNPKRMKLITLNKALRLYDVYLDYFRNRKDNDFKSFKEWLSTEI